MPNIAGYSELSGYLGNDGLNKLIELIIAELDNKQDQLQEMSAEDVKRIWDEEFTGVGEGDQLYKVELQ